MKSLWRLAVCALILFLPVPAFCLLVGSLDLDPEEGYGYPNNIWGLGDVCVPLRGL